MAEYVAGKGTTAMSIIGTSLGGLATVGGLMGAGAGATNYATKEDVATSRELAEKDATIALLQSNSATDTKLAEVYKAAAERDTNIRKEIYEEFKAIRSEIRYEHDSQAEINAAQGIVNANVSTGLATVSQQAKDTAALVASITKTAVPTSAVCNFGGCSSCSGNI